MEPGNLLQLPDDVFMKHITYLPFSDVISICSSHPELRRKCMNDHGNRWKTLIQNTFGNIYDYDRKLQEIQRRLRINGYNYLVYTQFINILDPVTQLMIYHKQNDYEMFYDSKFNNDQRAAALFLLGEEEELKKYGEDGQIYINILNNRASEDDNDQALIDMSKLGNLKGVTMMLEKGADINAIGGHPLYKAAQNNHFDIVRYLVEHGANVEFEDVGPIDGAAETGNLAMMQYLVDHGAVLTHRALSLAVGNNHLYLIPYFESRGIFLNDADANQAFVIAAYKEHLNVLIYLFDRFKITKITLDDSRYTYDLNVYKFLLSKGVNHLKLSTRAHPEALEILEFLLTNYQWDQRSLNESLLNASYDRNTKGVELLLDKGADIHYNNEYALMNAVEQKNLELVKFLVERGANINQQEIDIAHVNRSQEIYNYLIENKK